MSDNARWNRYRTYPHPPLFSPYSFVPYLYEVALLKIHANSPQAVPCHLSRVRRNRAAAVLHRADQARDIDDQSHGAVAQNGRTGDSRHRFEIRLETLDDDLLLREQVVHQDTGALAVGLDHHQQAVLGASAVGLDAELIAKLDDGQILFAQPKHLGAPHQFVDSLPRHLDGLDDGQQRDDVDLLADPHQLPVEDGERERQTNADGAAQAFLGGNLHVAAQVVDVPPHHVHADSAARYVADLVRGGKAGHKYQVVDLLVGQFLIRGDQPAFAGLLQYLGLVETGAVVAHFDDDVAALVKRRKLERARLLLAGGKAPIRDFETVVERVAHQVHQRIADLLEHGFVEFGAFAGQLELDFLAELARQIVHDTRKAVEREADRQHADLHHALLQLPRIARELRESLAQPVQVVRIDAVGEAGEHRLGDQKLADQVDDAVDFLGGDADGSRLRGGFLHRNSGRRRAALGFRGRRGLRLGGRRHAGRNSLRRGLYRGRRRGRGAARGCEFEPAVRIHPVEYLIQLGTRNLTRYLERPG